jgi:hypothetical protein
MLASLLTYASAALAAYPVGICFFRYSINELGYSKHESFLPYIAVSNAVLSYLYFMGGNWLTLAASLAIATVTYFVQVIGPVPKDVDMAGKVCIVTGSSSGIGQSTAQALVRMGAHVILGACARHVPPSPPLPLGSPGVSAPIPPTPVQHADLRAAL